MLLKIKLIGLKRIQFEKFKKLSLRLINDGFFYKIKSQCLVEIFFLSSKIKRFQQILN